MMEVDLYTVAGEVSGRVVIPDEIFGAEISRQALYQAVKAYEANRRQGTASAKGRSDVDASKRKLYRQKGTGRARAGSAGSPVRVGGGVAFGPAPRDYRQKIPKKVKRIAIRSALSARAREGAVMAIEDLSFDEPKTAKMAQLLSSMGLKDKKVLLLLGELSPNVVKSCRNIPGLRVKLAKDVSTYELLWSDVVLFSVKGLESLKEVLG